MYRRKIIRAGKTLEVEKYVCLRKENGQPVRGPKQKSTPEDMRRVNERNAVRELTWLINENFGPGDMHLTLTYRNPAPDETEAKRELQNYLDRLRRIYRKAGQELKYIAATEYKGRRIHHHLIINAIDVQKIRTAWKRGMPKMVMLDESGSYWRLAAYLRKELQRSSQAGTARIQTSRNLKRPVPQKKLISAKSFRKDASPHVKYQGHTYWPDASRPWEKYIDEVTGYEHYVFYYRRN